MELSQEDIVTRILSEREILKVDYEENKSGTKMFVSSPLYDLNKFLKTVQNQPSRWGEKYIFVK